MSVYRIGLSDYSWAVYVAALQEMYRDIIVIPF